MVIEVKCAICNEYYSLDKVVQRDNGYYCKTCYKALKRQGLVKSGPENAAKCADCGKAIQPDETRVKDGSRILCVQCYFKSIIPPRDEAARAKKPGNETLCTVCGKALTPYDDKVQENGKIYCKACFENKRNAIVQEYMKNTGFVPRFNVTSLSSETIECAHCGIIITPDRLNKDNEGKVLCPRCGKELPFRFRAAEKLKTEPADVNEDFNPVAQLFKCLGDPCRVKIIESLSEKELAVFQFVDLTGFQYSALSYHLKMLKDFGLVRSYKKSAFTIYSLTDKGEIVHDFINRSKKL